MYGFSIQKIGLILKLSHAIRIYLFKLYCLYLLLLIHHHFHHLHLFIFKRKNEILEVAWYLWFSTRLLWLHILRVFINEMNRKLVTRSEILFQAHRTKIDLLRNLFFLFFLFYFIFHFFYYSELFLYQNIVSVYFLFGCIQLILEFIDLGIELYPLLL